MINGKKVLALIPARGGSKGLPRKNILPLAGRPLLAWTVQAGLASAYVDRIIVSSEDREIIQTAEAWGAEAPFVRPQELAKDETTGMEVFLHALKEAGDGFDYLVLLQPTSPLRTGRDIDACLEKCEELNVPSCVSVCEARKSPFWMYKIDPRERLQPLINNVEFIPRRQDMPLIYSLNGAVYAARTGWLKKSGNYLAPETVGYVMPPERSVDIDSVLDLKLCEFILARESGK